MGGSKAAFLHELTTGLDPQSRRATGELVKRIRDEGVPGMHDERERMAREIHDPLAQGFVGIITQLQAAERAEGGTRANPVRGRRGDRLARSAPSRRTHPGWDG